MNLFKIIGVVILGSLFFSCGKLETPYTEPVANKEEGIVYIARSTGKDQQLVTFPFIDEDRTFKFSASFGGVGLPPADIPIQFSIDKFALDSVNDFRTRSGLEPYHEFPEGSYAFSSLEQTIKAGAFNSDYITFSYQSTFFDADVDYLLPVSITEAGGYRIGSNRTIFLIAPRLQDKAINKSAWSIMANSEELVGEGASNGKAIHAIDGDLNTFWHSKWQGTADRFPHWLHIDMNEEYYVTRIGLSPRQNATNGFTRFNIEASKDGTTWTTLGTDLIFDPTNKAYQSYPVEHGYWRHIKIIMTVGSTPSMTSTNLGEINVYSY